MQFTIQDALRVLVNKENLSTEQMHSVMKDIMAGSVNDTQLAGFLIALQMKGETVEEIAAAADIMRKLATKVTVIGEHIIDTCGTGGDGANTFNISTCAAFVVAAAGGQVAKHGSRSVSSHCGSADVLEAAGINLNLTADQVTNCVNNIGIGFLFAPNYHGAMKNTRNTRHQLGVRTMFNLLGPLLNPANAPNQLMGVFAVEWVERLAQVLKKLGSHHVLVVNAEDGLDEISIAAPTHVAELKNGTVTTYTITPEQFGFNRANLSELAVENAADSLVMIQAVLNNQAGAARDIVQLNAGAAIYAANITDTLAAGITTAGQVIASGAAKAKLNALIAYSNSL